MKFIIIFLLTQFITNSIFAEFELRSENTFESELKNRFHFGYGMNPSMGRSQDIKSITLSYAREWEKDFWVNTHYQLIGIKFRDLAQNNSTATNVANGSIEEEAQRVNSVGLGVLYRTYYVMNLLPFNLYELTGASLTYSAMTEKVGSESFKGPGLIATYAIMKPLGTYTHIGVHFDYNLSSLKRAVNSDTETSSQRSLSASWMTVGFNISFFL